MISGRFILFAAVALSCAALANGGRLTTVRENGEAVAGCLVTPTNGVVTADEITAALIDGHEYHWMEDYSPEHVDYYGNVGGLGVYEGLYNGTTHLPWNAFYGCTDLVTLTLPAGLTTMGPFAFKGCTNLATITLPDGLTNMDNGIFFNCTSLTTVTLPDSLTTMGSATFYGCTSLATVCGATGLTNIGRSNFIHAAFDLTADLTTACSLCSVTCAVENETVKVRHDTTSSHTQHKCFQLESSCICSCCDGAGTRMLDNATFQGLVPIDCAEDSNWEF